MKKGKIAIGVMGFLLITILLGTNSENVYLKKKHFNTTNELLYELETNKLQSYNQQGNKEESESFKECLSKRKRLTYSDFYPSKMEIEEIIELDEKAKTAILDDYYTFMENYIVKDRNIKAIEPIRLNAKLYYDQEVTYENGNYMVESYSEENSEITLVAIDEGEGFVIDYIVSIPKDEIQ